MPSARKYKKDRRRLAIVSLGVALFVCACMLLGALYAARSLYFSRARLRLTPVHNTKYAADNQRLQPTAHRIVFFGDSRILLWRPPPALGDMQLVFRGVPGETTAQMHYRFTDDVLNLAPNVLVLEAGINDLLAGAVLGRGPEAVMQVVSNVTAMVESAVRADIRVVVITVIRPARPELYMLLVWPDSVESLVSETNTQLKRLAGLNVQVVDGDHALAHESAALPDKYRSDTLHLNQAAYLVLNQQLEALLGRDPHAVQ